MFTNNRLTNCELCKLNLEKDNIENIKKIENLNSQLLFKESLLSESRTNKDAFLEQSKSALFELGSRLGRELVEIHKKETQESRELSEHNIKKTNELFYNEFIKITNMVSNLDKDINESKNSVNFIKDALLSPTSFGQLAEITLENILKSSGLKSGIDFAIQYTLMGEDFSKLRPDALVFLPGNNIMLIDAKSSKFLLEGQENQKLLLQTMNNHLKSLVKKDYAEIAVQELAKKSFKVKHTITIMFLPTEQAIEKISNLDQAFLQKSWDMNIFPVGPVGLMNMLSLTKFHISEQKMLNNYDQIISEVKKLLSSINILNSHIGKLESNVNSLNNNFQKLLGSFNNNLLVKVEKISHLGLAKSSSDVNPLSG